MQYKCKRCDAEFELDVRPLFCPFCGCKEIHSRGRSRETGMRLIAECNSMAVTLEGLFSQYIKLLAEYESKMQTLRVYKKRGIVSEDELPRYKKPTLRNELSALRARSKKNKITQNSEE